MKLTLATFNIRNINDRYEERKPLLAAGFASLKADIAGLKEEVFGGAVQVDCKSDERTEWHYGRADARLVRIPRAGCGSLLVVGDVVSHEELRLNTGRVALRVLVALPGQRMLWFTNTHLHHVPADAAVREEQALAILAWMADAPAANATVVEQPDLDAVFGRRAPRVLEIGFGMGDATAQVAAAMPGTDFIGIEVHAPGVGALLKRIGELKLANVRIVQHDAVEVLRQMVEPASLAGVHVWFPDPWHKKKHHKRRLIQPAFVALLSSRLAPGGYLHCATDWQPYAEQMLEVLSSADGLANAAAGYAPRPDWRPLTKFEARGLKLGHGVWDLVFSAPSAPSPSTP